MLLLHRARGSSCLVNLGISKADGVIWTLKKLTDSTTNGDNLLAFFPRLVNTRLDADSDTVELLGFGWHSEASYCDGWWMQTNQGRQQSGAISGFGPAIASQKCEVWQSGISIN